VRYQPFVDSNDFDVTVLAPNRWYEFNSWVPVAPADNAGIKLLQRPIRLPHVPKMSWYLHHYPHLPQIVADLSPQVIHLWEEPWSLIALQAIRLRNRLHNSVPIILEVDQNILKRLPPPFEALRRYVLRNTDYIVSRSSDASAVVRACGYINDIGYIGYCVDPLLFNRVADKALSRSIFDIKPFTIGYAGRLIPEKGLDDVIDALALSASNIRLAIMGRGPHESKLRERVVAKHLSSRVAFFPASEPKTVGQFLNAVDVSILLTRTTASVKEQFGRAIIESHACGTPVIGSYSGSIPEIVGRGGWIIGNDDHHALAALFDKLASTPHACDTASIAGLTQVATKYTETAVAQSLSAAWRCATRSCNSVSG
jgi:glycosyltransferase involved in cell wall biosynthesis